MIFLTMKISFLLITLTVMNAYSTSIFSQNAKVSINMQNATVREVVGEIEKQGGINFLFNDNLPGLNQHVSVSFVDQPIKYVLEDALSQADMMYEEIKDGFVVLLTNPDNIRQQQITVTGRVTDSATGEALPGVSVVVKGTTIGASTDIEGRYSITLPDDAELLLFSFIGMETLEIPISGRAVIDVVLNPETVGLDEVVMIGYGSVRRSDLTGSVSSVRADELQETPITSIDQGLVGRAAGVMVTQTSGMPGAVASIRIRGASSLQGGNEPLYVIDGFPVYSGGGFGSTGGQSSFSGLSTINPADIESIEILKDASATAIYGARATNGVVLITTKSGTRGSDKVSFSANYGVQNVVRTIDVMNALQYAELVNEARINDGMTPYYNEAAMQQIRQNPEGTDWQNEIFRSAPNQDYQLSFSGGDEKKVYSVSLGYADQQGIIRSSDFKRYSGRINLESFVRDNLRMGTNISLSRTNANAVRTDAGGQQGVVSSALKFNPVQPVFVNEELREYSRVNTPGIIYANPVATADEWRRDNQALRLLGNMFAELEIIPDLKAKVSFGTDIFNTKYNNFLPSTIYESQGVTRADIQGGYTTNWLNENTLSYSKEINPDHRLSALGGVTFQKNFYEGFSAASQDFVNNVLRANSLQAGAVYNQPSSSATEWSIISYLSRVNYTMKDRYLFSVNARMDGSSRFGGNNKYAFFPSGAFVWRMSEEDFIRDLNMFDNFRLRASYGVTGNQEIGLYNSLPTLGSNSYTWGGQLVTGFFPNKIPNPDLRWEKTAQSNFGVDLGFFRNRLRITSDYYVKTTTDLIYATNVPLVSGFATALENIGSIENRGWELDIASDNFVGAFRWNTSFNISFNKNKVLELGGEEYSDVGADDGHLKTGQIHRLIVGEPVGLFYGFVFDGIFQNQAELDAGPRSPTNWVGGRRYKDLSGDGVVDANNDRMVIGNPNPKFFGGLANTFSFKGFEANIFMQYSYGNDIFNFNTMEMELPSGGQNVYATMLDRWTPTNPSNKYPVASTNRSAVVSSAYIEDGSYLKLKTLTLAYTFPNLNMRNIGNLKLFVTGTNLLTFTNYSGYDPEVSYKGSTNLEMGEDFGGYPQAKSFMLGISLDIN
ncbi:MAG: SusC/RagA family TonB-linked outer membrane protein [Bacteroidales bacterium]